MRLSTKCEYGTRALIDLNLHSNNGPVLMKDIAKRQDITFKYLGQIFLLLKNRGFIRGQRGASGGYSLSKPAKDITLLEIFECLEGPLSITTCAENQLSCPNSEKCAPHDVWKDTRTLLHNHLRNITLEDLTKRHKEKNKTPAIDEYLKERFPNEKNIS